MRSAGKSLSTLLLAAWGLSAGSVAGGESPVFALDTRGADGTLSGLFALDTRDPDLGTASPLFAIDTRGELAPLTGLFTLDTRDPDLSYAPQNPLAEPDQPTVARLSWEYNGSPLGFVVERRTPLGTWGQMVSIADGSARSWSDTGVLAGLFYEYRIAAVLSLGLSAYSETACIQMPTLPATPRMAGAALAGDAAIAVSWQDFSNNEDGFELWRKEGSAGAWGSLVRSASNATSHVDVTVAPATLYAYKLRAFNRWGYSGFSEEARVSTPAPAEGCGFELRLEGAALRLDGIPASTNGVNLTDRQALLEGDLSAWISSPPGNAHPVQVVLGFRDQSGSAIGSPVALVDFYRVPGCPGLLVGAAVPESFRAPEAGTNTLWLEMVLAQRDPVEAFTAERHTQESPMRKRVLDAAIRAAATGTRMRIPDVAAPPGSVVAVPIQLISTGGECRVDFSVSFGDGLQWEGAAAGADVPQAWVQTDQTLSGAVGIRLLAPAENPLAAGSKHLATLRFASGEAGVHALHFQDNPVGRSIDGSPLGVLWEDGQVSIAGPGLEGDVHPWPCGDGTVDQEDVHLALLFAMGAIEVPADGEEFQRLDCAPAETCGDGMVDIADKVAILRYANGQDALKVACGPTNLTSGARLGSPSAREASGRAVSLDAPAAAARGTSFWVPIVLDAQGDEHALSMSLSFDPAVLAYQDLSILGAATNGIFLPNLETTDQGAVALGLTLAGTETFAAGRREIAEILFAALEGDGAVETPLAFVAVPADCRIAGTSSEPLGAAYSNATIAIVDAVAAAAAPPPPSGSAESLSMNEIKVSWSAAPWATGYRIRRKLAGELAWTRLADFEATRAVFVDEGLPAGALCQYLVTALNPNGDESSALALSASTWTAAEDWRYRLLGQVEDDDYAADGADPDFDGIPNRLERQLGTDPMAPDGFPFQFAMEELFPGSLSLTVSYAVEADASGDVAIEFIENLVAPGAWRSDGLAPVSRRREGATDLIKLRLPEGSATNRMLFLRMKAP